MSATISTLPVWKKGATAAEWLQELAGLAMEHPERWAKIALVFQEVDADNHAVKTRYYSHGNVYNSELLGMFEEAKLHVYDYMRGRV